MIKFRTPYIFRWIFHRRIWGFSIKEPVIYLTFDDGPTTECTEWILNTLESQNALATFFCVGSNVAAQPELTEKILQKGHVIGNHTMHHEKGTSTSRADYYKSIEKAAQFIDSNLFRPPYGRIPMSYTKHLRRKNYRIIMWTWLSYDYDSSIPIDKILASATSIRNGDILVLHDNKKSFERLQIILPEILRIAKEKNLKFGVISS